MCTPIESLLSLLLYTQALFDYTTQACVPQAALLHLGHADLLPPGLISYNTSFPRRGEPHGTLPYAAYMACYKGVFCCTELSVPSLTRANPPSLSWHQPPPTTLSSCQSETRPVRSGKLRLLLLARHRPPAFMAPRTQPSSLQLLPHWAPTQSSMRCCSQCHPSSSPCPSFPFPCCQTASCGYKRKTDLLWANTMQSCMWPAPARQQLQQACPAR
jgi:hypothetical protein